ncbi:GNAT family N-acetyltransferase [Listeria newyorkensis]|uniref:GNAT family N-acetyltransferase n=1 Tax=Listeria newyorkensis TaxID=1497681 RepID=A0A841YTQ3_9LIST|nr:GNAT family N-acetyltransferase [Listeria newyorkensis]MBC1456780.1 GNAT family N-acetyltransferase [Listeria newyorkensis]
MIETERLIFRELDQLDFADLCEILQDDSAMTAYEGAFTDEEVQRWLAKQLDNYERWGFGLWAVIKKDTGEFIGQVGLTMQRVEEEEVLEIGYLLKRKFWHQGFATEAALGCKKYALETLGAELVTCTIRDTNVASQKVAERIGMTRHKRYVKYYKGVEMPHYLYY